MTDAPTPAPASETLTALTALADKEAIRGHYLLNTHFEIVVRTGEGWKVAKQHLTTAWSLGVDTLGSSS
ncbi:hypothetical protein SAMN05421505_111123 [Sinosporangium album]|uniref:SnoaL-like domain-containing protein n=1 Tax=Sinosporangium album TaxID=504805 RepID=A0A1G7ZMJ9_9ACTN|nr:hypothetical protein [Sinosporangium album]SDH09991.1 hypothetical protein SAMN05421505_111123 [Sinosporangium album]